MEQETILLIDVKYGSPDGPFHTVGLVLGQIAGIQLTILEKKLFHFPIDLNVDYDVRQRNLVLQKPDYDSRFTAEMNAAANCTDEKDLCTQVATYINETLLRYPDATLMSDHPVCDIGYLSSRCLTYLRDRDSFYGLIYTCQDGIKCYRGFRDADSYEVALRLLMGKDYRIAIDEPLAQRSCPIKTCQRADDRAEYSLSRYVVTKELLLRYRQYQ